MWSVTLEVLSLHFPLYLQLVFSLTPSPVPSPHGTEERVYVIQGFCCCCLFCFFLLRRTSPRLDQKWKWVFHCAEVMSPMVFSHNSLTAAGVRVLLFGNIWHKLCHRPIICRIVPFLIGLCHRSFLFYLQTLACITGVEILPSYLFRGYQLMPLPWMSYYWGIGDLKKIYKCENLQPGICLLQCSEPSKPFS